MKEYIVRWTELRTTHVYETTLSATFAEVVHREERVWGRTPFIVSQIVCSEMMVTGKNNFAGEYTIEEVK